jgi:class 3 adenylate cyclase
MRCPQCAKENTNSARFCLQCGTRLTFACTQCGAELPLGAQFCSACGARIAPRVAATEPQAPAAALTNALKRLVPTEYAERLLATRGQVQAERRTVTILFCDVKGSTAMAENLDPEDVMEIMDGAFDVLIGPVYRYEGTLARLMGDAVLAFFGAPIAHEDDPERACRAALDIIARAEEYAVRLEHERGMTGFKVRVGIHTGLVVVGEVGSDLRVEYTAMGDAINLAARMESAAEPGTVLISEATHRLIAPLFETEALGPIQVKGKAEPVSVYRVLAPKEEPGKVRGIPGLESPLVGRETEFAALQEALERLQAGVGGIVTIVGEAGIGKSRLVAEVRRVGVIHELPLQWIEGRCLSYGTSVAYLLWLDVLRSVLAISVDDAPAAVRGKLREWVRRLCPEHFGDVYPYLCRLMSLRLEPEFESAIEDRQGEQLKADTFHAVEMLVRCAASQRPLVIVCEDMHWADPTSLELLERLFALTDRVAVLFICAFRPRRDCECWRLKEVAARDYPHRHTDVLLQPLSAAEGEALVRNLLLSACATPDGVAVLPKPLGERLVGVTEGNPLYVEEILRGLINQGALVRGETRAWQLAGAVEVALPDTLQGALLARIDRLQEDTKRVLQLAAVIGRVFLHRVLAAIAEEQRELDRHLITLQREQMIRERARFPELEYVFKHELTREAAYNGLLKRERRVFHQQVAEALERLYPERAEEQVELLAHHWLQAGNRDKAIEYLIRAGDRARRNYACAEAVSLYTQALGLVEASRRPDSTGLTAELLERRGQAHAARQNMADARGDFYRVLAWSRQAGDKRREAEVLVHLIQPLLVGHQLDEALARAQEAYALASELQDNLLIARSTGALGSAHCVKGELDKAHGYLQAALAAARAPGASDSLGDALFYAMMERNWVADFQGVLALTDEALRFAEKARDPNLACGALFCIALAQCGLGNYELALETLVQADEVARTAEMANAPAELLNTYGWVYQEIYSLEKSAELNAKCAQLAHDLGEIETEANALVNLGVDHLWQHELEAAEHCFKAAHALLERQFGGYRWRWLTRLLAARGELCLARGDAQGALDYAEQCLQLALQTSARKNQVKGWKLQGKALAALDYVEEAVAMLTKAASMASEIGNPPLIWKCHFALGQALSRRGRRSAARKHYAQAAATVEQTAAGLKEQTLREAFLSAEPVRAVLGART